MKNAPLFLLLLMLTSFFAPAFAQAPVTYKNLVFEGAGIRGIAYGGVIEALEKQNLMENIEKVGGTSAGAITALMLSLGYRSEEITSLIFQTNFNRFNSGRYFFFGGFYRMNKNFGWYRGDKFSDWLENIIRHKTGNPDITFAALHQLGYKDLYITATCLNRQTLLIFSRENYPQMKVKDAVRISMSVPLYFEAIFIDSTGLVVDKPADTRHLDLVMDGGITANFPIFLFDSISTIGQQEHRIANPATLGVRIDTHEQIAADRKGAGLAEYQVDNLQDYVQAFYIYVLENLNRPHLTQADWDRTVSVSSAGIGPRVKRLSAAQKNALLQSGRTGVSKFFNLKQE